MTGFEPQQHSMYTFEGQIEQLGTFARAVNRQRGWRRYAGKLIFLLPFLAMGLAGVVILVDAVVRWLL